MKKRIIKILIMTLLVNSIGYSFYEPIRVLSAESIEEKREKIVDAENRLEEGEVKKREIEKESAKLRDEIEGIESKLEELIKAKEDLKDDNENIELEILEVEEKIEENYEIISSIVKIQYEQKVGGYLSILLEAKNFGNFLRRLEMVSNLIKDNDKVISETKELEEELNSKKDKLREQIDEIERKTKEVEVEKESLQQLEKENKAKISELIKIQTSLSREIKLTENQIDELESRGEEINNEINTSTGGGSYNGEKMAWPVSGYTKISSYFGYRKHPISGVNKLHTGIDIPAPAGTPVTAANSGTVIISRYENSYGNIVAIDHGGGVVSFYAHNTERLVKVGDKVSKGQKISTVGTTGYSTGNHLHFEVKKNGQFVDPMNYLK